MNPDTAEMAVVDPLSERLAPAPAASSGAPPPAGAVEGGSRRGAARTPDLDVRAPAWLARLRADPARMTAVRECWRALVLSRALVWAAGVGAIVVFGFGRMRGAFDPPGVTRGFGALGDLLAGPAARWDSAWYLVIAHYGYRPDLGAFTSSRTAFFPLYPLGLKTISALGTPPVLAGVMLSLLALALALYGIHRLTTLELAGHPHAAGVARLAVLLTAFAPMAFYLSAVYSESLYLALSVGVFWCARKGRWASAAALGALAGATRSSGIVLALPVLILYLYGPREDRAPDRAAARFPRPRYRLRRDALWLALLPAGIGAYTAYLALSGGEALMPFHVQEVWSRHFAGPYLGVWDGARAAFDGARQLLSMQRAHAYFQPTSGSALVSAGHNVMLFAFLALAAPALVGVLRKLPLAYGAYVLAALVLPLSYPVPTQPLMSLSRFLVVLFPLGISLALWLTPRPRVARGAVVVSALLLALFVGEFATWHWVA